MTTRRLRSLLWFTTACLLLATAAIAAWVFTTPTDAVELPAPQLDPANTSEQASTLSQTPKIDRQDLQAVTSRDFRKPLFDPPPPPEVVTPPKPLPQVVLISTILRAQGEPSAWVRDGQTQRKVTLGDTVGPDNNPATITAIEANRILINHESGKAQITRDGTKPQGAAQ